ncbi:MAG: hypothetical protein L3J91_04550, partial [Thermoplasmata archaeon]|nr:hypothetical protein [Thermoplasmata archaeon]
ASWNISTGKSAVTLANYTTGAGLKFGSNLTELFNGAGSYLTSANVNGTQVTVLGWQYNVTLQVWDGAGHRSVAYLAVLVQDHQKPTPILALQDVNGKTVSGSGLIEGGTNDTAQVILSATNSTDPHNGSIVTYQWKITNSGNSSAGWNLTQASAGPSYKLPSKPHVWLQPQAKAYTVNLTVTDRANNTAYVTATLTVTINTSTRPVLSVTNLTAPTSMTDGSSYTIWANVTNTIGKNSTANAVSVRFYLLPPSGVGSGTTIGGSPSSVQFFNYTSNTTVTSSPVATGSMNLPYNHTVRVVISFNPSSTGSFDLWVNASASNEFISDYKIGSNQAHVAVTLNQNPIIQDEEIGGVIAVVAILIVAILYLRSRSGRATKGGAKKPDGGKSGADKSKKDADDDDDE